ncbi:MAG: integration host factor subunit beta [Euryarchaeota archaeon]|nr:integration host factor subunit beta [Euryarchaeota archaeon]|tara:strand:+ start:2533 stop:2841 length:309 start_codon:yes stop_codon:yes gene_type:complete
MLKSHILEKLHSKHNNLTTEDIELLFNIFLKKISNSLKNGQKIEIRGFGTLSRKINKEKYVRNPKTNEKLFKNKSFKLHFKIGKILHQKINNIVILDKKDEF